MMRVWLTRMRFMREHHWTSARLSEYLDGELTDAGRARIHTHTELCPECRRLLRTLRRTVEGLMGLRSSPSEEIAERVIQSLRRQRGPEV